MTIRRVGDGDGGQPQPRASQPTGATILPTAPSTAYAVALDVNCHACPAAVAPQPLATLRVKVSSTSSAVGGVRTSQVGEVVLVCPSLVTARHSYQVSASRPVQVRVATVPESDGHGADRLEGSGHRAGQAERHGERGVRVGLEDTELRRVGAGRHRVGHRVEGVVAQPAVAAVGAVLVVGEHLLNRLAAPVQVRAVGLARVAVVEVTAQHQLDLALLRDEVGPDLVRRACRPGARPWCAADR